MRRLPVYILLDTSGSMRGEPIEAVKSALDLLVGTLRQDPYALETVWLSMITFDRNVKVLVPLTPLETLQIPAIDIPEGGPTFLGQALKTLCGEVKRDVIRNDDGKKGDWRPILFVMTDGSPSDIYTYNESLKEIESCHFSMVIACTTGPRASADVLKMLAKHTIRIDSMDTGLLKSFFTWVSASVSQKSLSKGGVGGCDLPPPPQGNLMVV